jgi:hypothetical protein
VVVKELYFFGRARALKDSIAAARQGDGVSQALVIVLWMIACD